MKSNHAFHAVECEEEVMASPVQADIHHFPAGKVQSVMDPRVYKIALGCWVIFLAVFWATFWISANALFMVVVGTFYAFVFFGVPYMMSRMVKDRPEPARSLFTFLRQPFATLNGTMRGGEALLQVVLVPLCLIAGGIAIGFIIRAARVAY
ncbi:MAG: hypothetical protein ABI963_10285 [Rhizomicrobium sp.]